MATDILEKKVHYLGQWTKDRVDNGIISDINSQISGEKGNKVKLQLSRDGLRVVRTGLVLGKILQEFVPVQLIQFMTVSQRLPDLLLVIALCRPVPGQRAHRFHILAFRCANGMDASIFMNAFRKAQRTIKSVSVVKAPEVVVTTNGADKEEINWTLRSKEQDNSKRELKKLVDLHGEKAILHKTNETHTHTTVVPNGHTEVYETGVRIPLYRKGRPTRLESSSAQSVTDESGFDSRSEVSESALRQELDTLSQELRDIKLMLEQSTGITAGSERASPPGSPRDFKPVDVAVHRHTVAAPQQEEGGYVVRTTTVEQPQTVRTVVVEGDEVQMRQPQSGFYNVSTTGATTHVRVSVPDYRGSNVDVSQVEQKPQEQHFVNDTSYTVSKVSSGGGYVTTDTSSRQPLASTTSYESWKADTLTRNSVVYKDIPERIQWRSRTSQPKHVVTTTRSRSAIPSFSDGGLVKVRHTSAGYGPTYQRVAYGHTTGRPHSMHSERRVQAVKTKSLSTTVQRPIEKVYTGRSDASHHSVVLRQVEARPTILAKNGSVRGSQVLVVEQNNNVVKPDTSDDNLLDVSGIDLYNSTPREVTTVTTVNGDVIRT